jgi:DNA repair ATPase RecN
LSGQSLNAAKVPPDVLQITYSKTLNDLYGAMLNIYGDNESETIINTIRDNVRGFSAGVDFFRFEEGSFLVTELSEAIQSRLVSTKQIHGTYIEIFKRMAEYAPNYESQDFRSFVETGSREYAVEKIAEHNHRLKDLESLVNKYLQELDNVSENMGFVAQLQNQQLEEIKAKSDDIINIKDHISSLSHAVNLHTRLFKKLNSNLETIRSQLELIEASSQNKVTAQEIISMSSDISQAVPSQPEIAALATSLNDLREQTSVMVSELYSRVDSVFSDVHGIEAVSREVASLQEQLQKLRSDMQEDVMYIDLNDIDNVIVHEGETAGFESDLCIDLNDIHEFTGVVVNTLGSVGPSTLKQLNKALFSSEVKLDEEELMQVLDEAISSGLVTSQRKGRYLYYNVNQA